MKRVFSYIFKPGRVIFIAFLLFLIVISCIDLPVSQSEYLPKKDDGYVITNYVVDVDVDNKGVYSIREDISVHFNVPDQHGIYRYFDTGPVITYRDKNNTLKTKSYKCAVYDFEVLSDGMKIVATDDDSAFYKIYGIGYGQYITCQTNETFSFKYKFSFGDDRDTTGDLFYQNIIGTGWGTSIQNVQFSIRFPAGTDLSGENFSCYRGRFGQSSHQNVGLTISGNQVSGSTSNLQYGEALTVFNMFDEGFFHFQKSYKLDIFILVMVIQTICVLIGLFIFKRKKDPVIEVVEFKAPNGLTPTEVGYINDGSITGDDLSALIVYWASKGYVKLEEEDNGSLVNIKKLKNLPKNAKGHEQALFDGLFHIGDEITSKEIGNIGDAGLACKSSTEHECKKYFDKIPDKIFGAISGICIFLLFLPMFGMFETGMPLLTFFLIILNMSISGFAMTSIDEMYKLKDKLSRGKYLTVFILTLIACFAPIICLMFVADPYYDAFGARFYVIAIPILLFAIYPFLERYTKAGREALGSIRGLRRYIQIAEKNRIEKLVKDNPKLFYEVLPYAYVLGVSNIYMDKFKDIKIIDPNSMSASALGMMLVTSHLLGTLKVISKNFSPLPKIKPPSTGGFGNGRGFGGGSSLGGGGFSGGGFGGGGGGRF